MINNERRRQKQMTPVYGETRITREQEAVLKLSPRFTTYERILENDIECQEVFKQD